MNYLYFWYIQFLKNYHIPQVFGDVTFPVIPFFIVAGFIIVSVLILVYAERKILALFTQRKGPNRVGYKGIFQTIADALKLLCKQNIDTDKSDKFLFNLAPIMVFVPVMVLWGIIPYSSEFVFMNFSVSALLYLSIAALPAVGIILAGFASGNKYSLIGSVRSVAQIISYELPVMFVLLSVVVLSSSLNLKEIVFSQLGGIPILNWNIFPCFIGFAIMIICTLAELNRCPFDLPEAESELVAGYNTEYSGMRFALFFLAEYAMLFIMSAFIATIFLGGFLPIGSKYLSEILFTNSAYLQIFIYFEQVLWLMIKTFILVFIFMLIRATLPRLGTKSLMQLSWYVLFPLSVLNFIVISIVKYFIEAS